MKKAFLLVSLILFLGLNIQAQNQSMLTVRLEKSYLNNPEECIKLGKEYAKDKKERAAANYYLSLAYYQLYLDNNKTNNLSKAAKHIDKYYKYAKKSDFVPEQNSIKEMEGLLTQLVVSKLENKKYKSALKYSEQYIALFKDTLDHHFIIVELLEGSTDESEVSNGDVDYKKLLADATKLIGSKYKYGGSTPKSGMDCSGFNLYVFNLSDLKLPHSSQSQSAYGSKISVQKCKPGDLIFFGASASKIQHAGIIYSNDKGIIRMIHCPRTGVCIEGPGDVGYDAYWAKRFLFIKRISKNEMVADN
ncbi:MAG: C40 family peptidase [Flavobacteriales bacterium]|nr:C40 family peptidase [Flavobacteriales bacterium]